MRKEVAINSEWKRFDIPKGTRAVIFSRAFREWERGLELLSKVGNDFESARNAEGDSIKVRALDKAIFVRGVYSSGRTVINSKIHLIFWKEF